MEVDTEDLKFDNGSSDLPAGRMTVRPGVRDPLREPIDSL